MNATSDFYHSVTISGLATDTTYYYNITACDEYGCSASGLLNVKTTATVSHAIRGGGGGGGDARYREQDPPAVDAPVQDTASSDAPNDTEIQLPSPEMVMPTVEEPSASSDSTFSASGSAIRAPQRMIGGSSILVWFMTAAVVCFLLAGGYLSVGRRWMTRKKEQPRKALSPEHAALRFAVDYYVRARTKGYPQEQIAAGMRAGGLSEQDIVKACAEGEEQMGPSISSK
jgi:hypothetical protein